MCGDFFFRYSICSIEFYGLLVKLFVLRIISNLKLRIAASVFVFKCFSLQDIFVFKSHFKNWPYILLF